MVDLKQRYSSGWIQPFPLVISFDAEDISPH